MVHVFWRGLFTFPIIKVFSRPPFEEVVYQCHASFIVQLSVWCWRRENNKKTNEESISI